MLVLDSTVLIAALNKDRAGHQAARAVFQADDELAVTNQTLRETLAVATRPATANGLGLVFMVAWESVLEMREVCAVWLMEDASWWAAYTELAIQVQPTGRTIYDLGQVAAVRSLGREATLVTDDSGLMARYGQFIKIRTLLR